MPGNLLPLNPALLLSAFFSLLYSPLYFPFCVLAALPFHLCKRLPGPTAAAFSVPAIPLPLTEWLMKAGLCTAPLYIQQGNTHVRLLGGRRASFWRAGFKLSDGIELRALAEWLMSTWHMATCHAVRRRADVLCMLPAPQRVQADCAPLVPPVGLVYRREIRL